MLDSEDVWTCYLCSHTKRGQVQSSRFHRSLSNPNQATQHPIREKTKEVSLQNKSWSLVNLTVFEI